MKREFQIHLLPLLAIFLLISSVWFFAKVPYYQFVFVFVGFSVGAFFLDIDHLIFWSVLKPNLEESKLAHIAIEKKDFISIMKLINSTRHSHTSLIFHHFFFQVILALVSVFVFTSSNSVIGMSTLLAINIHLLVDEINDYQNNKVHLQNWLFARESKQIPIRYLKHYIAVFSIFTIMFILLLIRSQS